MAKKSLMSAHELVNAITFSLEVISVIVNKEGTRAKSGAEVV